jgi:hypothetical protein
MQNLKLKIQNLIFLFGICLLLFVFAPQAHAAPFTATGNPDDTLAGTLITAEAANETLNYTDINDNPKPQVTPPSDIRVTVLPVYGFSVTGYNTPAMTYPGIKSYHIWPGQTRYWYVGLTNEGNVSDTYTISVEVSFGQAGPGSWLLELYRMVGDVLIATFEAGGVTSTHESVAVAEDGTYWWYFKAKAPFPSTPEAIIPMTFEAGTSSTPVGQYTGANGLTYGGLGYAINPSAKLVVARPFLELTRYSTVDAPKAAVGFTGDAHYKVPGSIITYQFQYNNRGNVSAESIILVDKLPTYSGYRVNLAHICKMGDTDNVNITYGIGAHYGWSVFYSTWESPQKNYGDPTDWIFIGTLESGVHEYFPAGSGTYSLAPVTSETQANWLKFERQSIPSGEVGDLSYGVTIR